MSEKKENTAAEAPEGDDNPWDDDDGARTVATGAPIDLPSDVPSPITNPPPAMPQAPPPAAVPRLGGLPPKKPGKATMIGIAGPAPGAVAPPELGGSPRPAAGKPAPPAAPAPPAPRAPAIPSSGGMPVIPRAGANPSSQRMPIGSPLAAKRPSVPDAPTSPTAPTDDGERQEDGPTMAVPPDAMGAQAIASLREAVKRHSPMSSPGYSAPPNAASAPIDALAFDNKPHPVPAPPPKPVGRPSQPEIDAGQGPEETTRAVSREELLRHEKEDHVVVGDEGDAVGDEATLAVGPGQIDLGPGGGDIAAALQATLGKREDPAPAFPPPPPAFPPPPGMPHAQPGSNPHMPAAPPMTASGATAAMPSYRGAGLPQPPPPQSQQPPYDPMMPNNPPPQAPTFGGPMQHGGYPSSGHQPVMGPPGQNMPMSAQGTHPMMGNNMGMPMGGMGGPMAPPNAQHPNQQPPPWMTQPSPPPAGMVGGFKITPQVIMLAVVGVVCLAIFVVGIVLFVQTKF